MHKLWPDGGPWVLVTTSTAIGWQLPAAALAAASTARVAALVLGGQDRPDELLINGLATYVEARDGATDPLTIDEAAALVLTLAQTHGLVLVVGVPGLLVPIGRAAWTVMDLAAAVAAPVVVAADAGPDATNHTTLALGALTSRGLAAAVVTVGCDRPQRSAARDTVTDRAATQDTVDCEKAAATAGNAATEQAAAVGETEDDADPGLPVAFAGRIPADAADRPDDFAVAAREWLNPILHASAGRPKTDIPPPTPQSVSPPATTSGKRVVLLLVGVFVAMSLAVCGLAFCDRRSASEETTVRYEATLEAIPPRDAPSAIALPPTVALPPTDPGPVGTRAVSQVCPQYQGQITATKPDPATTERVNAAWKRIEDWLTVHAPHSRRSLRPAAAASEIVELQKRMSVSFPPDLVASLRRHDGVTAGGFSLPFIYRPLPVNQIAGEWRVTCEAMASVFAEADSSWWDKAYVPFATSGDGGCLLVDQRPGSRGRVGEFYNEDGVNFAQWPASVVELLEKTAHSLETGRPYDNRYKPKVGQNGAVEWDILQR